MKTLKKRKGVGKVQLEIQSHSVILNSLTLVSSELHEYTPKSTCPLCCRMAAGSRKVSIKRNSWKALPAEVIEHHLTLWPETLALGGNRSSEAQTMCSHAGWLNLHGQNMVSGGLQLKQKPC